jgi:predicted anti-sigma-YlaC factor YlaD
VHGDCDRARQWASADVDGELSAFERFLLENHLAGCPPCREYSTSVGGLTKALRAAPLEPFEVIVTGRNRRRVSLRFAPAAAAMAVAVVGLGSILASSEVRPRSVAHVQPLSVGPAVDTMNLRTQRALERLQAVKVVRVTSAVHRSLRGGPVLER